MVSLEISGKAGASAYAVNNAKIATSEECGELTVWVGGGGGGGGGGKAVVVGDGGLGGTGVGSGTNVGGTSGVDVVVGTADGEGTIVVVTAVGLLSEIGEPQSIEVGGLLSEIGAPHGMEVGSTDDVSRRPGVVNHSLHPLPYGEKVILSALGVLVGVAVTFSIGSAPNGMKEYVERTMSCLPLPANVSVSPTTRTLFTATGISILWDTMSMHLVELEEDDRCQVGKLRTLAFVGEQIIDVTVLNDMLFVLTSLSTEIMWRRPWKRRNWDHDDIYKMERRVCKFLVRAYRVPGSSQVGETLVVGDRGVHARITSGPARLIVEVIGKECVASFWATPNSAELRWIPLYREITWDPDIIARCLGFRDAQEEIEAIEKGSEQDERCDYTDEETVAYAFLSDTCVVRLRDRAEVGGVLDFQVEVFEIPSVLAETERAAAAPILLTLPGPVQTVHTSPTEASMTTERSVSNTQCLCICIHNTATVGTHITLEMDGETTTPFLTHTGGDRAPPITAHKRLMFPALDLDPTSAHPDSPLLRFMRFTEVGEPPKIIDVPIKSLIQDIDDILVGFMGQRYYPGPEAPWVLSWDGKQTLCVVFCATQLRPLEEEPSPQLWYIRLSDETIEELN
ncbi:hypothetical protein B0H13DRAFT_1893084 [Mycena leptocephala]|nr:hypothetical protein B0H13DRAFT_1893084 [Mycena leptocephala]